MNKRKFDIAMFGLTEEEWVALSEERRIHYTRRAYYQRNKAKKQAYQRRYNKERKKKYWGPDFNGVVHPIPDKFSCEPVK